MTSCNSHELSHVFNHWLWRCYNNVGKCKIAGQRANASCNKAQYDHNTELHLKLLVLNQN